MNIMHEQLNIINPPQGDWQTEPISCETCKYSHPCNHAGNTILHCNNLTIIQRHNPRHNPKYDKYSDLDCPLAYPLCKDVGYERRVPDQYDFEQNPPELMAWAKE